MDQMALDGPDLMRMERQLLGKTAFLCGILLSLGQIHCLGPLPQQGNQCPQKKLAQLSEA